MLLAHLLSCFPPIPTRLRDKVTRLSGLALLPAFVSTIYSILSALEGQIDAVRTFPLIQLFQRFWMTLYEV